MEHAQHKDSESHQRDLQSGDLKGQGYMGRIAERAGGWRGSARRQFVTKAADY